MSWVVARPVSPGGVPMLYWSGRLNHSGASLWSTARHEALHFEREDFAVLKAAQLGLQQPWQVIPC